MPVDVHPHPRTVDPMKNTAAWARDLARKHLEVPLPRRWAHTQGVARQARTLAPILGNHADLLEAAAWLHDIGYAPDIVQTGFHPLDGARYLRDTHHANEDVCRLVAHHSCAIIEAKERGLAGILAQEFYLADYELTRSLIYCDMTTTPDGSEVDPEQRLAEIIARYGKNHIVSTAIEAAKPQILKAVIEVRQSLTSSP
jgi:predicted hydrolase (HD superfamily)